MEVAQPRLNQDHCDLLLPDIQPPGTPHRKPLHPLSILPRDDALPVWGLAGYENHHPYQYHSLTSGKPANIFQMSIHHSHSQPKCRNHGDPPAKRSAH